VFVKKKEQRKEKKASINQTTITRKKDNRVELVQ